MNVRSASLSRAQTDLCRRLNYAFVDPALLARALTHRSHGANHYERLEFLGDSVLNLAVSTELYHRYPDLTEGELTRLRASLVKQEALAQVARELALGESLRLGGGEMKSGGFDRDSILADALEAVFGAVYLDAGVERAKEVILRLYASQFAALDPHSIPKDPKTRLQERLQKRALPTPVYHLLQAAGEPHRQTFLVECRVPELGLATQGEGHTRRHAEQQAARAALERLEQQ